jgi:uncharacterized protein
MGELPLIAIHEMDDPERATIPFVPGVAAIVPDMEATILLQMEGGWLAKNGQAQLVLDPASPPLADLLGKFLESGGRLLACGPCAKKRGWKQEDLVEGATIVNAPAIIKEIGGSRWVVTY